jgi:hypothetical protein
MMGIIVTSTGNGQIISTDSRTATLDSSKNGILMLQPRFRMLPGLSAVALIAALGSVPAPAAAAVKPAAATLAFTSGVCPEAIYAFGCTASWTGGTAPYTVQWTGVHDAYFNSSAYQTTTQAASIAGDCVPGTYYEVTIRVTDVNGNSVIEGMAAPCDA